jgi:hypothetical protein
MSTLTLRATARERAIEYLRALYGACAVNSKLETRIKK